jgi:aconitate hydratase 2/2-methylisocitrate dehydratase
VLLSRTLSPLYENHTPMAIGGVARRTATHGVRRSVRAPVQSQYVLSARGFASAFRKEYEAHAAERAAVGIVPEVLSAKWTAEVVELLKNPPAGEEDFALNLLKSRVPPGVDDASYVKAAFLAAVAKGEAASPLITREAAVEMLGKMVGGYNVAPLVAALDEPALAPIAAEQLSKTILMFDAKFDVE